ncbi:MAG: carbohydrate kinase family protein [Hyphomicrobium sp.]
MKPAGCEPEAGKKVLTIGGAMIDTIAVIDDELIERMSMNNADRAYLLLEEGRKTEASEISTHAGGGAINTAVSFGRLGCQVVTLVKLGQDSRARAIRDVLQAEGISQDLIAETAAMGTGASVLISAHERNAAIFTFRGANSLLQLEDLPDRELRDGGFFQDIVYITGLSDRSADVFPEIVDRAASCGAFVAANPGIRQLTARGHAFQKALANISLLSMNREEAAALLPLLVAHQPKLIGKSVPVTKGEPPELMRRSLSASGFEMTLPHFFQALLSLGPQCILVTDGKYGAYAATGAEIDFCPSISTNVVGTAGAGDAFTSTFTLMFSSGMKPGEALHYATANASSVVGFADTQSGLLNRNELEKRKDSLKSKLPLQSWRRAEG